MKNELLKLVGLKVMDMYGVVADKRSHSAHAVIYILFEDGETVLELEEQDYHSYHDCSSEARILIVRKDPDLWKNIVDEVGDFRRVQ